MNFGVWLPLPKEFDEWKEYTNTDEYETFSDLCEHLDAMEKHHHGSKIIPLRLTVAEMKKELEKRGLPNTSEGRQGCCAILVTERNL